MGYSCVLKISCRGFYRAQFPQELENVPCSLQSQWFFPTPATQLMVVMNLERTPFLETWHTIVFWLLLLSHEST